MFRAGPGRRRSLLPFWFWLVLAAGLLLVFDVAVRRVAPGAGEVGPRLNRVWLRLRGRAVPVGETAGYLERLGGARATVTAAVERRERAQRRFESEAAPAAPPPMVGDAAPPPKPAAPPAAKPAPKPSEPGGDYFEKLRQAKKRAHGEDEE